VLIFLSISAMVTTSIGTPPAFADGQFGNFWVGGRIYQEYAQQGGPAALGNPTNAESAAKNNGRFQNFANDATIYWHQNVAGGFAKMVRGDIKAKHAEYDWEWGALGYPTISEHTLADGKYNTFEGGSIYWSPSTGAHVVWGNIRDQWAAQGYETGSLGYPVTDEYEENGGFQQQFEGGYLSFNVGPTPSLDPNGTSPTIGVDDPYNKYPPRYAGELPVTGQKCSTPDAEGNYGCLLIGDEVDPDDGNTDARTAPPVSTEPTEPTSTSPTSTSPTSNSPTSTEPRHNI